MGFFDRLVQGLTKTRNNIVSGIDAIFNGFSKIDQHKNQQDKQNLLNKKALLEKPDLTPELKIMAKRLDSVIKSNTSVSRLSLLQLNPFGSKTAIAAEPMNIYPEEDVTQTAIVEEDIIYKPMDETSSEETTIQQSEKVLQENLKFSLSSTK